MTTAEQFAAIYTEQAAHVHAIAASRVRPDDRDLVEDLVQEAFLRLWAYLRSGRTVRNPSGLLGTMTVRAAADWYRVARNTRERATDLSDPFAARVAPAAASAEDIALLHVEIERLLAEAGSAVAV